MCELIWQNMCSQPLMAVQTIVLLLTAGVVAYYTVETYRLRAAADAQLRTAQHQTKCQMDAHTFDAVTRVHQLLSSPDAIRRRRWLYDHFKDNLRNALRPERQEPLTTKGFNQALQSQFRDYPEGRYDPLENVEGVLADLNVLGISCRLGIEAAGRVAKEYESVISKTAPFLLPFVKKQRELRSEPAYKREYVSLLQSLDLLDKSGPLAEYADMASLS